MKKKLFGYLMMGIVALSMALSSCSGSSAGSSDKKFIGKYEDEFGNKFELREDYTATIQFAGQETVNETHWFDGPAHNSPFATIEYNGDVNYYFMRDGFLYRHRDDMEQGKAAIKIKKE
ncbi:MAG: hypothetical protein J6I72_04505 [Muribaculaceae bacterium]|nr:hypothetical protein [Muribaculaceae bacterium]